MKILLKKIICKIIYLLFEDRNPKLNQYYLLKKYEIWFNKKLNLDNPQTFNEKINWIKLRHYNPLYETCADKYEVRKYVESKGLKNILTNVYKVYDDTKSINFDELPPKFVLKTVNSSGHVCIIKNKNNIKKSVIISELRKGQRNNLYRKYGEWQYKNIKPRIMAEELIENNGKKLYDYKFFCFGGKVKLIYAASDINQESNYPIDFFDTNWKRLNITRVGHPHSSFIARPKNLSKMMKIVETLSEDFMQVRVDLYSTDTKIYFGELTFTTGAGYGCFLDNADLEIGKYFKIYDDNKTN